MLRFPPLIFLRHGTLLMNQIAGTTSKRDSTLNTDGAYRRISYCTVHQKFIFIKAYNCFFYVYKLIYLYILVLRWFYMLKLIIIFTGIQLMYAF